MTTIPTRETMTVEFKSDRKGGLPDGDLIEAIVCLANADGGTLYLGVEKDGRVSGLDPKHREVTGLPALVQNRTMPSVYVTANVIDVDGTTVAKIDVPKLQTIVSTRDGKTVRRRLDQHGEPECMPFLPHEFSSRLAHFGNFDFSAQTVPGLGSEALDPIERARLRKIIEANALADKSLLKLNDDELDGALEFIKIENGQRHATYTGLLVIGHESLIRQHLPNHEVAFQAFKGTRVIVNEFFRAPLIRIQEQLENYYRAHVVEQELQVGMFRVAVPNVDHQAYREAIVNALTHRDYAQRGQIYIQWKSDILSISSPGGLLEGVTPDNIHNVPPTPRNPTLASAFKRAGLSERTGRGVDLIYEGLVKYGRPLPRYSRSTATNVIVDFSVAEANLLFVELVTAEQNKRGEALPLEALLVLHGLFELKRGSVSDITDHVRILDSNAIRLQLEHLVEAGLAQPHGVKKGRTYTLSANLYGKLGKKHDYIRQAGIDATRHPEMVLAHVTTYGKIKRDDVINMCGLSKDQASRLLTKMTTDGKLAPHGQKRGRYYTLP